MRRRLSRAMRNVSDDQPDGNGCGQEHPDRGDGYVLHPQRCAKLRLSTSVQAQDSAVVSLPLQEWIFAPTLDHHGLGVGCAWLRVHGYTYDLLEWAGDDLLHG